MTKPLSGALVVLFAFSLYVTSSINVTFISMLVYLIHLALFFALIAAIVFAFSKENNKPTLRVGKLKNVVSSKVLEYVTVYPISR